jgi:hypothetical protein
MPERPSAGRYYRLVRRRNDRSPLRFNKDDNKNSHRAETEVGLRLMGQPSRVEYHEKQLEMPLHVPARAYESFLISCFRRRKLRRLGGQD